MGIRWWDYRSLGEEQNIWEKLKSKKHKKNIFVSTAFEVCRPTDRRYYGSHFIKQSACGTKRFSFKYLNHKQRKKWISLGWPTQRKDSYCFWLEFLHYRVTIVIKSFCFGYCHKDKLTKNVKLLFPKEKKKRVFCKSTDRTLVILTLIYGVLVETIHPNTVNFSSCSSEYISPSSRRDILMDCK